MVLIILVESNRMREYLILKLHGPMQAWSRETFEGLRPSDLFPGRSALLGLIGACLGIDRFDQARQSQLAQSVGFAVRVDSQGQKMTDYHTVKNARVDYRGLKSHDTIQTWREYWQDSCFTVAIWNNEDPAINVSEIAIGMKKPVYTPVLGRRSCPIARPLYECFQSAEDAIGALSAIAPVGGTVYSDEFSEEAIMLKKRDVPIVHQPRQFASRSVYMTKGVTHVS
jgi:CRISPR system Cascade subunit CasD